jgi:hypothetical protein
MIRRGAAAVVAATALGACGGGGGGGSAVVGGGGPVQQPSVSGDMMALAPSRGWNYQGQNSAGKFTVSLYADPQPINGATAVGAAIVNSFVPTVITSGANFNTNLAGIGGFNGTSSGYNVFYELSLGSSANVPGSPQLVPSTLTQGQVFNPYAGVTATVTSVGAVAGASACPVPANGAVVSYAYAGQTYGVTYVPGCGITQFVTPTGTPYTLISVATYASIGQLSSLRRAEGVNALTTVRSLLGLERNPFPAGALPFR